MGNWDEYCSVCCGPFVSVINPDVPELHIIDDKWLNNVTIKCIDSDIMINNCRYEDYGQFKDPNGIEYNSEDIIAYHGMCVTGITQPLAAIYEKYESQFFDIETMINDGNHIYLDKNRALAYCTEHQ
jgi:hypothetical protein